MNHATDRSRSHRSLVGVVLFVLWTGTRAEPIDAVPQSPPRAVDGAVAAEQQRTPSTDPRPVTGPPPLDLGERVIRKAIADSKDPMEGVPISRGAAFGSTGATRQQDIDRAFRAADIPTCMTSEAYKFDPSQVGPFVFPGLLALPFLVHAIATGKCRH